MVNLIDLYFVNICKVYTYVYPFVYRNTPWEQINAGNISGYISEEVITKMLSEQKNKQKGKWVDEIIETKKSFDILESSNKKTKGLKINVF